MHLKCSQNLLSNFQQLKLENSSQMEEVQSKIKVIKIWQFTFKPDRLFIEPDDSIEIQVIDLSNNFHTGIYNSRFIYVGIEEIGIQSPKLFKGDKFNFTLKNHGQYELNCLNIPKMKCLITVKNNDKIIKQIIQEQPIEISPLKQSKIDQFDQKKLQLLNEIKQQKDLQIFTQKLGIQDSKSLQIKINQLQQEDQIKKKAILDQIQINQDIEQLKKNDFFINQDNYKIMVNKGQNSENQLDLYKPIQDDINLQISQQSNKKQDQENNDQNVKKQKNKQKKKKENEPQAVLQNNFINQDKNIQLIDKQKKQENKSVQEIRIDENKNNINYINNQQNMITNNSVNQVKKKNKKKNKKDMFNMKFQKVEDLLKLNNQYQPQINQQNYKREFMLLQQRFQLENIIYNLQNQ